MSELPRRRVVVVGGGITGLATAYALGKGEKAPQVTLLESRQRLGGNIQTERVDDFVIDPGPDAWVVNKPDASALAKEIGLEAELVSTVEANRRVYIAWDGELHAMPEGLMLGIPTEVMPFLQTPLLSLEGKLRAGFDLFIPPKRFFGTEDESVADFVSRRLGEEVSSRLVAPLLGGIFAGDAGAISVRASFASLVEAEAKYGSLIRAMRAQRKARGGATTRPAPSAFVSMASGMGKLIDTLGERVAKTADVRLGRSVTSVDRAGGAAEAKGARFALTLDGGEVLFADDVVFAVPTRVAAALTRTIDEVLAERLSGLLGYSSTAAVFLAFRRDDVTHPLDATGFIVPHAPGDERALIAGTFVSSKWAGRAPAELPLFRAFLGGSRIHELLERDDADLVRLARRELGEFIGATAEPVFARVYRHRLASPQPTVGHHARREKLDARLAETPGIHVGASGVEGVGIPDCIKQAKAIAARITAS